MDDLLQRLKDHLHVVPFDTDRKYFRLAIRAIEERDREIEHLQSLVESYKKKYPIRC